MRIHVTGSNGWIGSYCVKILKKMGHELNSLNATHLLHLGWDVTPGYWNRETNVKCFTDTCKLIYDFQKNGGKRVVAAGTCANPEATLYGRCKFSVAKVLEAYNVCLSTAYGRIFYLYGPGEQPQRLVPSVIMKALKKEEIKIDHPFKMLDYMYVEDVAMSLCKLLLSDEKGSVDIGTGEATTTLRIAQLIVELTHGDQSLIVKSDIPSFERTIADPGRIRELWEPKWPLKKGLSETIKRLK